MTTTPRIKTKPPCAICNNLLIDEICDECRASPYNSEWSKPLATRVRFVPLTDAAQKYVAPVDDDTDDLDLHRRSILLPAADVQMTELEREILRVKVTPITVTRKASGRAGQTPGKQWITTKRVPNIAECARLVGCSRKHVIEVVEKWMDLVPDPAAP